MSEENKPIEETDSREPVSQEPEEELAYADDAVIGNAIKWSVFAMIGIAILAAVLFFALKPKPKPVETKITPLEAPETQTFDKAEAPKVTFTDITDSAGITFRHNNGAVGEKLLPETMGGGVAFFDYNNDGTPDLLFVNSNWWPEQLAEGKTSTTSALYRNDGGDHFTDVTDNSGLDVAFYGMGTAIGDYDNDGLKDVFITAVGENHLFKNLGDGKFREVTATAGVGGSDKEWSSSAVWVDVNNDGRLDLFVCNYIRWSRDIDFEVGYTLVGLGRAYGPPMNFEGTYPYLYLNNGDGTFTDISESSGIQVRNEATDVPAAKSLAVAPSDLNGDGWMDLVIANDTVRNFVFINQQDNTFEEAGALSGLAFDSYGNARGAMGIDTADVQNDSSMGVAIGNFANEMTALFIAQKGSSMFTDEAIPQGIGPVSRLSLTFGLFFFDYDLDGWQDLLAVNGHLEDEINKVQPSQKYRQPAQLFWNAGGTPQGGFIPVGPDKSGGDLFKPIVGRGSAFADIDGDGDQDVVFTQIKGPPVLLRNDQQLDHHWIRLKLIGAKCNRDGIGARVRLKTKHLTLTQQVMPTRSYLSQSEPVLTFGLGKEQEIESAEVTWPGGATQPLTDLSIDSLNTVKEGGLQASR